MASKHRVLHPLSGALILGLDWLLFSGTMLSLGLSTGALMVLGLVFGGLGTGFVQRHYGEDSSVKSLMKGVLGGVTVGLPLPVAGTAVGGAILAMSGLNRLTSTASSPSTKEKEEHPNSP